MTGVGGASASARSSARRCSSSSTSCRTFRARASSAELVADDAPAQPPGAVPDENGLIGVTGPEAVDPKPDRTVDVAADGEDETVLSELRVKPRRRSQPAPVGVNEGPTRRLEGLSSIELGPHVGVEQDLHSIASDSMPGSASGNCGSSRSSASTSSSATATALTQFRSAGTTYHGAQSVDVSVIASS